MPIVIARLAMTYSHSCSRASMPSSMASNAIIGIRW